jgi:tetratricopeptide (TPR) repeat protein
METVKRSTTLRLHCALAAGVLLLVQPQLHGQSDAEKVLIEKARALDSRGRVDLGAQNWQQVLLSDPKNTEAMAGAARDEMQMGNTQEARKYLERLAEINPHDPNIAQIEGMKRLQAASPQTQRAGKLAQAGHYAEAMEIYRQVYGNNPPAGDIALAYYETEAALPQYREQATAALRDLAVKYPGDPRYEVALGRILTFDVKTRKEGVALLEKHSTDPQARLALRQALTWDADNPATIPEIRAFLRGNSDPELEQRLQATEARQAKLSAGLAKSQEERAAYMAMSANHLDEAQKRFEAILATDANNPRALAGLGFLDMRRSDFAGAVTYLEAARSNGMHDKAVEDSLQTARFWNTMAQATAALNQNQTDVAIQGYRAALSMRPANAAALQGLAGALLKQQPVAAESVYREWLHAQPRAPEAWLGLFTAQTLAGDTTAALATSRQFPESVRMTLSKDPSYLRALASAYSAAGQDAEAQRVLQQALNLPFPNGGMGMKADTQMQYASLLLSAGRAEQAAGLYRQVLSADPANVDAYQGLIRALHAMNQDAQALQTLEEMPPAVRETAQRDAGFQLTLASIYVSQGRNDVAQGLLEQAMAGDTAAGRTPPPGLALQLAGVYIAQGNAPQAFALYQQVLTADPTRVDAWTGLLSALHQTGRDREALAELPVIPRATYAKLNQDPAFLEVLASIYSGAGNAPLALATLRSVNSLYQNRNSAVPATVELQYAWLLLNSGDNVGLYAVLMQVQSRPDLTQEQMGTLQTIWATWSVQRASLYAKRGNTRKALEILDAANRAFPNNLQVQKALAGGYAAAGDPKRAVGIYLTINWTGATAVDYRGAIGAALAARDLRQADTWLEAALKLYPNDAQILQQAGQYEQARGDKARAVDYFKASLEAMGPADPNATLTQEMQSAPPTGNVQTMSPSQDLVRLMAPGADTNSTTPTPLASYASGAVAPPVPINSYAAPAPVQSPPVITSQPVPSGSKKKSKSLTPPPQQPTRLGDYNPTSRLDASPLTAQDELALSWMAGEGGQANASRSEWTVRAAAWIEPQQATASQDGTQPKMHLKMRPALTGQDAGSQPVAQTSPTREVQSVPPIAPAQPIATQTLARTPPVTAQRTQPRTQAPPPAQTQAAPVSQPVTTAQVPVQISGQTSGPAKMHLRMPGAPAAAPADNATVNAVATPVAPVSAAPPTRTVAARTSPAAAPPPTPPTRAAVTPVRTTVATPATVQITESPMSESPRTVENVPGISYAPAASGQQIRGAQYQTPATYQTPTTYQGQSVPPPAQVQPQQYSPSQQATAQQQYNQAQPPPQQQPYAAPLPPPPAQQQPYGTQSNNGYYPSSSASQAAPPPTQSNGGAGYGTYSQAPGQTYNPSYGPGYSYYNDAQAPVQQQPNFQRVLPPLTGYGQQQLPPRGQQQTTREQVEEQLGQIEGGYSPWLGATAIGSYRSGQPGFDRFAYFTTPIEASTVLGDTVRATVVVNPVIIDAGTPAASTTYRQGTQQTGAIPYTQTAAGTGGELQLRTTNFGIRAGYTPYGFLVGNIIGGLYFRPGNGPVTVTFSRDPITDTQLSYSGLRDIGQSTQPIWGGVMANSGELQIAANSDHSGFYLQGGGQYITGAHVQTNWRGDGDAGAFWRVKTWPEYGSLTLGMNVFAMHYEHNLRYFTYGQGGYFSPQGYLLANVPVRFDGHHGRNLHYRIEGSFGIQGFQEDATPYFPIDPTFQVPVGTTPPGPYYPTDNRVGGNYLFDSEVAYRVTEHWYAGAFLSANNTRDYNNVMGGFYVRYMFRPQYPTEEGPPTGIFPVTGFRPVTVP